MAPSDSKPELFVGELAYNPYKQKHEIPVIVAVDGKMCSVVRHTRTKEEEAIECRDELLKKYRPWPGVSDYRTLTVKESA